MNKVEAERLKPCKYCNGEPKHETDWAYEPDVEERAEIVVVKCSKCRASTDRYSNVKEAEVAWNAGRVKQFGELLDLNPRPTTG